LQPNSQIDSTKLRETLRKIFTAEVIKFIVVGGVSALIEFSLLILFVEQAALDYLLANVMAFGITNIFTFILSRRFVFNSSSTGTGKAYEATLFVLCLLGGLLVNQVVLWAMVEFTFVDYRAAKVIAILVTVVWNFFTRKHLVFRNREVATQRSARDF
jgi:putative flippase GtrA